MPTPSLVCIHSLTAHGTVGLKVFISVLGERCLPVPSLLLNGPGNMPGFERFPVDVAGLLRSTLLAAHTRRERVIVFVGYLSHAAQVPAIQATLAEFASTVAEVWVDPVSGDHGAPYVSSDLIAAWPALLAEATWIFPNLTEAELLTGRRGDDAISALCTRFPKVRVVVTGIPDGHQIETRLVTPNGTTVRHTQPLVAGRYSGTGDLFAARFARALLVESLPPPRAVVTASQAVAAALQAAREIASSDLCLHPEKLRADAARFFIPA